jgi:hypothetical protein
MSWLFGLLFVVLAISFGLEWRRRQRIAEAIRALGGSVVAIELASVSQPERVVRYVANSGEARRAVVSTRVGCAILQDRPMQDILREEYRRTKFSPRRFFLRLSPRSCPASRHTARWSSTWPKAR